MSSDDEESEKLAKLGRAAKTKQEALDGVAALEEAGDLSAADALERRQKAEARYNKVKLELFPHAAQGGDVQGGEEGSSGSVEQPTTDLTAPEAPKKPKAQTWICLPPSGKEPGHKPNKRKADGASSRQTKRQGDASSVVSSPTLCVCVPYVPVRVRVPELMRDSLPAGHHEALRGRAAGGAVHLLRAGS
jgi:hypothetical protein